MKKIILLGYMGSGKSKIALLLSQKLQIPLRDADQIIEENEKMPINLIFENKGEIYFRKAEHQVFKQLIESPEPAVISLGGGTPCYADNHKFLKGASVVSVYLKASVELLHERLLNAKTKRPLIADKSPETLKDFIAQHLFERSYFYHQATHTVSVDAKSPQEIVSEIESFLI